MFSFYRIENSKPQVGSGTFVPDDFTEYEVGKEPEELLLALEVDKETERINAINAKTGEVIYGKYSIEKQFNVSNLLYPYTVEDREEMFMFNETARAIGREARDSGITVDEIDWLEIDKRIALQKLGGN